MIQPTPARPVLSTSPTQVSAVPSPAAAKRTPATGDVAIISKSTVIQTYGVSYSGTIKSIQPDGDSEYDYLVSLAEAPGSPAHGDVQVRLSLAPNCNQFLVENPSTQLVPGARLEVFLEYPMMEMPGKTIVAPDNNQPFEANLLSVGND